MKSQPLKIFALVMAALMLMAALTACDTGGDSASGNDSTGSSTPANSEQSTGDNSSTAQPLESSEMPTASESTQPPATSKPPSEASKPPTTSTPTQSSKPPETSKPPSGRTLSAEEQKLVGTWGWFEGGGDGGQRIGKVYEFHQDGTFRLYLGASVYSFLSSGTAIYINAYENFFNGNYTVSGNKIVFSDVVTVSITVSANGDKNGSWETVGTRGRAAKMQDKFPTNGYHSYELNSEEYKIIDANTIGFAGKTGYGSDGYFHYEKNWVR